MLLTQIKSNNFTTAKTFPIFSCRESWKFYFSFWFEICNWKKWNIDNSQINVEFIQLSTSQEPLNMPLFGKSQKSPAELVKVSENRFRRNRFLIFEKKSLVID